MISRPAAVQHLRDLARLRRVRDRIDRDYLQPLDVEALARGVNMSAGHLSRQFRLAYGESPYSYLMTRRIERAMALLRRGDLSVTDVSFPYPAHRSAVTDCEKLLGSGIAQRYAVLIYSYEYPKWPAEPTLRAFEALAGQRVTLGPRHETTVGNLVHPYHRQARVSAWEVFGLTNG